MVDGDATGLITPPAMRPSLTVPVVVPDGFTGEVPRDERTATVTAHAADDVLRRLRDQAAGELRALLVDGRVDASRRLAAISLGTALLCADVLDAAADAARHLDLADRHPLAPGLRIALALAGGDRRMLDGAHVLLERQPPSPTRTALLAEVAGAWLHGFADAPLADAAARLALDGAPRPLAPALFELATMTAATVGDGLALTALLVERAIAPDAPPAAIAAAVGAMLDRRRDPAGALALASSALAQLVEPHDVHGVRLVDLALEAALATGDGRAAGLASRRARATRDADEAAAWHGVAQALADHGPARHADALTAWSLVVDGGAAAEVLALTRAIVGGDPGARAARDALAARAPDEASADALAHRWRVVQQLAAVGADPEVVVRRARWVHQQAPTDESARLVEHALWILDPDALARTVERAGPAALDRAVTIAGGRLGDVPRALRLLRRKLALVAEPRPRDLETLAALLRRGRALAELAEIYERLATMVGSPATAATWWLGAGLVHLGRGRLVEAGQALEAARAAAPGDALPMLALIACYRLAERWTAVAPLLEATIAIVADSDLRTTLQLELAEVLTTRLGEAGRARGLVEALVAQRPGDETMLVTLARTMAVTDAPAAIAMLEAQAHRRGAPAVVDALAELYARVEAWAPLAALLRDALAQRSALGVERRGRLARQLAEVLHTRLGATGEACAVYEALLGDVGDDLAAIDGLAALYAALGRVVDQEQLLVRGAALDDSPRGQARRWTAIATTRAARDDIDGGLAAWRQVAAIEPGARDAFAGFEQLAYRAGRWPALLEFYAAALLDAERGVPGLSVGDLCLRQAQVLRRHVGDAVSALARTVRAIESDGDLDQALHTLTQLAPGEAGWRAALAALQRRIARCVGPARDEAQFVAARLVAVGDVPAAEAQAVIAGLPAAVRWPDEVADAAELVYGRAQDWPRLLAVLRRRLATTPPGPAHVTLASRIATLGEQHLRDSDLAVEHYQRILATQPDNRDALEALARIYEATERWTEVVEVSRRLVGLIPDRNARALLLFRCGSVTEAKFGQEADAVRYYEAAIKTSPACMPAVHGLRDLYRRRGAWAEVVRTLELEVDLWEDEKEQAGVYAQLAGVCAEHLGDEARAARYYARALEVDPGCIPANLALFDRAFARGAWADAVARAAVLASKAMREGDLPARAEFYRRRAVALRHTGELQAALDSARQAVELWPSNLAALDEALALSAQTDASRELAGLWAEFERIFKRRDDAGPQLARVELARARLALADGDLDRAGGHARAATRYAPGDLTVVLALVELDAAQRRWPDAIARLRRAIDDAALEPGQRTRALWRLVALHAEGELRPDNALAVLRELRVATPTDPLVPFRAAQEAVALGRLDEAGAAMDDALALATRPEAALGPTALASYLYYAGRIADGRGDLRGATQLYRRAHEYAPGFPPAALALARRALDNADFDGAQQLLVDAAHAAIADGGAAAAVPLQRGLARVALSAGDRERAIDAYRGILAVAPDEAADRAALAELYAIDDPSRAIVELRRGLERSLHYAPAYRLLASLYERIGLPERAARALATMAQLGFAAPQDEQSLTRLAPHLRPLGGNATLGASLRQQHLAPPSGGGWPALWALLAPIVEPRIAPATVGERLAPLTSVRERVARTLITETAAACGSGATVYVADRVPGLWAARTYPSPMIVLDRTLLVEAADTQRCIIGIASEAARGAGGALREARRGRLHELRALAAALAGRPRDGAEPDPGADDGLLALVTAALPPADLAAARAAAALADGAGLAALLDEQAACQRRTGLVACGSLLVASAVLARLAGEPPGLDDAQVPIGIAVPTPGLVRFFLGDDFHHLARALA